MLDKRARQIWQDEETVISFKQLPADYLHNGRTGVHCGSPGSSIIDSDITETDSVVMHGTFM